MTLAARLAAGCLVWWVDASSVEGVVNGLREVALAAGAGSQDVSAAWRGDRSAPDLLWRTLESMDQPWLLVLDNADDPAVLDSWLRLPRSNLVVGRRSVWGRRSHIVQVPALSDVDGAALLPELAPLAGNEEKARELSKRLSGVPLALCAAGRLLERTTGVPAVAGGTNRRPLMHWEIGSRL